MTLMTVYVTASQMLMIHIWDWPKFQYTLFNTHSNTQKKIIAFCWLLYTWGLDKVAGLERVKYWSWMGVVEVLSGVVNEVCGKFVKLSRKLSDVEATVFSTVGKFDKQTTWVLLVAIAFLWTIKGPRPLFVVGVYPPGIFNRRTLGQLPLFLLTSSKKVKRSLKCQF